MQERLQSCLSLTLTLLSVSVMVTLGQDYICTIDSRPHPRGICGAKLARAHSNLCFLLSQAYPDLFRGRRSPSSEIDRSQEKRLSSNSLIERIYSIPLSVLAELDLSTDNWGSFVYKRAFPKPYSLGLPGAKNGDGAIKPLGMNKISNLLLDPLVTDGPRLKRQVLGSSMVCDCCYNVCRPRHLATYC